MSTEPEHIEVPELTDADLRYVGLDEFCFEHLPPELAEVSKNFAYHAMALAAEIGAMGQVGEHRKSALHYLLLSKDATVRAHVLMRRLRESVEEDRG